MSRLSLFSLAAIAMASTFAMGCASMIVGSSAWFDKQRPDVEPVASSDLACTVKPLEFVAVSHGDFREVEARGCGKKVQYKLVKVSFVEKWVKSSDVKPI
ncbi:hypothetical protein [Pendulispora albinea]|uniref:Lipoprotein n=1 Tax=Pendulispora albinea TaxID=2741071 RepID=A0ABZ2M2W7_9BACT